MKIALPQDAMIHIMSVVNVASVKTAPIKGLEMDSEQEVVWGNNNGLHWVDALIVF